MIYSFWPKLRNLKLLKKQPSSPIETVRVFKDKGLFENRENRKLWVERSGQSLVDTLDRGDSLMIPIEPTFPLISAIDSISILEDKGVLLSIYDKKTLAKIQAKKLLKEGDLLLYFDTDDFYLLKVTSL